METITQIWNDWKPVIIMATPILAEILLRLPRTSKSYSILRWVKNVIDMLVPDKSTTPGEPHK